MWSSSAAILWWQETSNAVKWWRMYKEIWRVSVSRIKMPVDTTTAILQLDTSLKDPIQLIPKLYLILLIHKLLLISLPSRPPWLAMDTILHHMALLRSHHHLTRFQLNMAPLTPSSTATASSGQPRVWPTCISWVAWAILQCPCSATWFSSKASVHRSASVPAISPGWLLQATIGLPGTCPSFSCLVWYMLLDYLCSYPGTFPEDWI